MQAFDWLYIYSSLATEVCSSRKMCPLLAIASNCIYFYVPL